MQKTCVVIPCYNESERLNLNAFQDFLNSEDKVDFLFANDGSTDTTYELLQEFQRKNAQRVHLVNLSENSGKAEAVRQGILEASVNKDYVFLGFWDADLATPLSEINYFLSEVKNKSKKIGIGSRMKRLGATVERKRSRHLLGRIFSTFSSLILKMPVYDTQCGAKIFSSDMIFLFEEKFYTRWLFDIELLARYRNKFGVEEALNTIIEIPVNVWAEKSGSKLKLKHMLKVPFELLTIYKKYN